MGDRCRCCRRSFRAPSSRAISTLPHPRSPHTQTNSGCSLPPLGALPSAPDISLCDDRRDVVVLVGLEEHRFLYSQEVYLDCVASTLALVHVADEYMVPELFTWCLNYLLTHVDTDNVLEVLTQLSLITGKVEPQENLLNEVKDRCRDLIDLNAEWLLTSDQFCDLPQPLVADLVARSSLRVKSEMSVANALVRWATQACLKQRLDPTPEHRRALLGEEAIHVRFFQLKEEFLRDPVAQSLLDSRDLKFVLDYMNKRLKPEQLPQHLRYNLGLCERRLAALKGPVQGISKPGNHLKVAAPRQRKTVCQRFKKGFGTVAWAVIAFLD
ncbi:hypothetical protein HPB47_010585 [Ixodes persulcatus]|uniref:Uncharacterized protein n=1 Tax=Ixodes persulcatus TaxID=34615 RepID=A0AC60NYR3_IXOPE|nr:hypothetical protein HPB47_010585 [Ixodes persulcatus]